MISLDWMNIGYDAVSMVLSFLIISLIAFIALWILDRGLSEVNFLIIKDDPKAVAIASVGWLIIYALAFAGSIFAPFSLNTIIVREILWTFLMVLIASVLTIIAVKVISPCMSFCGKNGLNSVGQEPVATSILYLGLCILIGIVSFGALTG